MITPRLQHLQRSTLYGSIAATTAFLLINLHAFTTNDMRPTILSNAALVITATGWLAFALTCASISIAARLDKLRVERELRTTTPTTRPRPERLQLVPPPEPQPRRRRRLPTAVAPGVLLASLAVLVALGVLTPQGPSNSSPSGAPARNLTPATAASTVTVTVTADTPVADPSDPSSTSPRRSTPTSNTSTAATAPPSSASATAAPPTTKTKRPKPTTPSPSSSADASPTSASSSDGSADPQNLPN